LAQGVAGQVASKVQNLTGISQLTLDPSAGNNQNPGAQVAIQQRVTGTLLLTFSTDVTSTQKQTVQLQYEPKKQVRISVLRDKYGGYGVDVRYHKVFCFHTAATEANLRLADTGSELVVRYPIDNSHPSGIVDHVTRVVVDMVYNDPAVKTN
jgi:hypothetical protein